MFQLRFDRLLAGFMAGWLSYLAELQWDVRGDVRSRPPLDVRHPVIPGPPTFRHAANYLLVDLNLPTLRFGV